MSFFYHQELSFDQFDVMGLWSVCRIESGFRSRDFLTEYEQREYYELRSASRKSEWLAARVAIKKILLRASLIESPLEGGIEKDRFGRPYVRIKKGIDSPVFNCSISHKEGVASACISWVSDLNVGIDMETVSSKPRQLREAFVNNHDSLPELGNVEEEYSILWACKEASSKAIGLGWLLDFRKLTIRTYRFGRFAAFLNGLETMQGKYFYFNGFIIAICCLRNKIIRTAQGTESQVQ